MDHWEEKDIMFSDDNFQWYIITLIHWIPASKTPITHSPTSGHVYEVSYKDLVTAHTDSVVQN